MIVGRLVIVERLLAHLLRDRLLGQHAAQIERHLAELFLGQLRPLAFFRVAHLLDFRHRHDSETLVIGKPFLADVRRPVDRIAFLERRVDDPAQVVDRYVIGQRGIPVIGNLERERLVKGVMRERGQQHVVVGTNAQLLGKAYRRILLALVGELFGTGPQISVQNTVQPVLPSGRERLVRIFHHGVDIRLDDRIQLAVHMPVGSVPQAGIDLLGHDAVTVNDIHHVVQRAPAAQIGAAVHADIAYGLFKIGVADDPHLRQIMLSLAPDEQVALDLAHAREAPACARARLILDRGDRNGLHVLEHIGLRFLILFLLFLSRFLRHGRRRHENRRPQQVQFHQYKIRF